MKATRAAKVCVKDVMTANPTCIHSDANLRELAEMLEWDHISGVPVVDDQERVIGVVSKTDIVRRLLDGPDSSGEAGLFDLLEGIGRMRNVRADDLGSIDDLMSTEPITASPDEPIAKVARRMAEEKVHRVVVVDASNHPIGIVTTLDLLKRFPAD
jgi:CBS domain-containing protein